VKPRVTLAIPVYNSAQTLERCVRSAMTQTLREIEILVADDGSTDGGGAIAERLAREDHRVRVLRMDGNGGKSRAMNTMAAQAQGVWFAVLDADDMMHESRLEHLVNSAEQAGVEMAADNLEYYDAGVDRVLRCGFDRKSPQRIVELKDLLENTSSFADFDLGILKPIVRLDFVRGNNITYQEQTRLAEDFFYLLEFLVDGGRCCLVPQALYRWTMPFGTVSRRWTTTGLGAWRYDYREALQINDNYIALMTSRSQTEVVKMLRERGRQYRVMVHYLDAQRAASIGQRFRAGWIILRHPSTYRLLMMRITGRIRRALPQPIPAGDR
jgi:succinoglycan biosynthesis protein ExoO